MTPAPPLKLPDEVAAAAAVAEVEAAEAGAADDAPGSVGASSGTDGVDEGSEMVNVWLIGAEANLVEVLPESERGVFWSGNAYMVLYSYTVRGADRSLLFWKGADVTDLNFLTWRFS